jgi:hypothetical protein
MSRVANFNLPQPFFQTTTYGLIFPPRGGSVPCGVTTDARWVGMGASLYALSTDWVASSEMCDNVRDQVTMTLCEMGFAPKGRARSYQKPYMEYFNFVPYP